MPVIEALGRDHDVARNVIDAPAREIAQLLADHPSQRRDLVLVPDNHSAQEADDRRSPEQLRPASSIQRHDALGRDARRDCACDHRAGGRARQEIEALAGRPAGRRLERLERQRRDDAANAAAVDREDSPSIVHGPSLRAGRARLTVTRPRRAVMRARRFREPDDTRPVSRPPWLSPASPHRCLPKGGNEWSPFCSGSSACPG